MQDFVKVREVIFIKSLLKNILADTKRLKYTIPLNFGFIMSGFYITAETEENSSENDPIKHSIISICILQCFKFFRRSSMSKNYFLCFLFC